MLPLRRTLTSLLNYFAEHQTENNRNTQNKLTQSIISQIFYVGLIRSNFVRFHAAAWVCGNCIRQMSLRQKTRFWRRVENGWWLGMKQLNRIWPALQCRLIIVLPTIPFYCSTCMPLHNARLSVLLHYFLSENNVMFVTTLACSLAAESFSASSFSSSVAAVFRCCLQT